MREIVRNTVPQVLEKMERRRVQAEAIFKKARDLPAWTRASFLDEACAESRFLRLDVEALLDGQTLADRIAARNLGYGEILGLAENIARRLHYLHKDGRVHGNLRPENVAIDASGRFNELLNYADPAREPDPQRDLSAYGALLKEMIGRRDAARGLWAIAEDLSRPDGESLSTAEEILERLGLERRKAERLRAKDLWVKFFLLMGAGVVLRLLFDTLFPG